MESSQNEVKVNRQYYWHILQSEQMLTGIKQETDDNSVFQHESIPVLCVDNTVPLLQHKINFTSAQLSLPWYRD